VLPIPYIHRDEEEVLRAHLRARRPVLLIGSSMVGKTKMAAQVLAEEFISWPVAIPDSKTALAEMDAKDVTLQDSVIWLDDINRLIGAGGITDGALRRLATSGNVIVGTIRARAYDQLRPSDQLRLPEWDVLCAFEHVFLRRELSQREQERLASAVTEPDIQARIQAVGLGEYVGAARQVAEALELGAAGTEPLGYALVVAAAGDAAGDAATGSSAPREASEARLLPLLGPDPEALLQAWRLVAERRPELSPSESLALAEETLTSLERSQP